MKIALIAVVTPPIAALRLGREERARCPDANFLGLRRAEGADVLEHDACGLVESWVPVGAAPPLHVHHREDESFWVLEGQVRFRCGDEDIEAGPGSFVFLPRDVPHTFIVDGDEDAHMLTLLTPGGFERYFVDAGRTPEGPGLPPPGPPDVEKLQRLAPVQPRRAQ